MKIVMTFHLTGMGGKIPKKTLSDMMQKQIEGMKKQPGLECCLRKPKRKFWSNHHFVTPGILPRPKKWNFRTL